MEEYQRRLSAMAVPTYEQWQGETGGSWKEYVSAFSAAAAGKQVQAGEIPGDYGASHVFTPSGVWVKSGSPAAIGGLPGEITTLFPGVEEHLQTSYKAATEGSVITTSRVGEPQISFSPPANIDRAVSEFGPSVVDTPSGGTAPIQFNDPGAIPSLSLGNTGLNYPPDHIYWDRGKGVGGNGGEEGGMGILALIAMVLAGL